jgi:hypothetical protein
MAVMRPTVKVAVLKLQSQKRIECYSDHLSELTSGCPSFYPNLTSTISEQMQGTYFAKGLVYLNFILLRLEYRKLISN